MTTVVLRLATVPPIRRAIHHAWTACLSAALTVCVLVGAGTTALTITFIVNPLTHGPLWQLAFAPPSAASTHTLARYVWAITTQIRNRT